MFASVTRPASGGEPATRVAVVRDLDHRDGLIEHGSAGRKLDAIRERLSERAQVLILGALIPPASARDTAVRTAFSLHR
jgi:hypothetical protein